MLGQTYCRGKKLQQKNAADAKNAWFILAIKVSIFLFSYVVAITSLSAHEAYSEILDSQIVDYFSAYDQCEAIALERKPPDANTLSTLLEFDVEVVTPMLHAASFEARRQCERPALTELAYTILLLENNGLDEPTKEVIEDIKTLVFSDQAIRFFKLYGEIPAEASTYLDQNDYFRLPFDERKILEHLNKLRESDI